MFWLLHEMLYTQTSLSLSVCTSMRIAHQGDASTIMSHRLGPIILTGKAGHPVDPSLWQSMDKTCKEERAALLAVSMDLP